MKPRRLGAYAVALVFAVSCGVWLNYIPYAPGRLLVAVPAEASWISVHRDLDLRWDELVTNPVFQELGSLEAMNPALERIRPLFRRETLVAYVPQVGPMRKPAWFLVSWIGARSFQLQWWLNVRLPEELENHPIHRGRNYWTVKDQPVAFALEEGMLIACITEDAEAILSALVCFDGSAPSAADVEDERKDWLVAKEAADRGWYRAWSSAGDRAIRCEMTAADGKHLALQAHLPAQVQPESEVYEAATFMSLFGDLPAGLIQARPGALEALLAPWSSASWATEMQTVLRDAGGERLVLALFGGEYSGRLRGVRVPAFVAALPVADEARALRAAASSLHRLNQRYPWGLFLKDVPGETNDIHLVDAGPGTAYAEQPVEEKIAFGVTDGCLLVASNYDTLQRLLVRSTWARPVAAEGPAGLWHGVADSAPMSGSFDLDRTGKALRNGLAVYSMTQMMSSRPGASLARARTETVKKGVMGLQKLGTGHCRLHPGPDGAVFTLELGHYE